MKEEVNDIQPRADDPWEDLILSILSVNNFSIEKAFNLAPALRKQGLLDPRKLVGYDRNTLFKRLNAGGYARGDYVTGLLTDRLTALGEYIRQQGVEPCTSAISGTSAREIEKFLLPVKGIGPRVVSNFVFLRGIQNR